MDDYWCKQQPGKPLFENVLWSRPERRDQSGRLAIVGGNIRGFWAVASAYQLARRLGVGETRAIMPDVLRAKLPLPVKAQIDDLVWAPSNPSGGLAAGAEKILQTAAGWSGNLLFVGDNGGNAETAQLLERFVTDDNYAEARLTLARDSVDLIIYGAETVLNRQNCNLIVSLAQLQKLARAVYYPRMITFSQGVRQLAETLHKFTVTYPATMTVFHDGNLLVAANGQVVSQEFDQPMRVWNGEVASRAAVWSVWQADMLKAVATSWIDLR